MAFLVTAVLVVVLHLAIAIGAWTGVGLLADDHQMVGAAILRHRGQLDVASMFVTTPVPGAKVALYRPFIDLLFWLEQPCYGFDAFGYHVTNSILHCGTALAWFLLLRRWLGSTFVASAAAVLFVTWAGHGEATHWIAARVNLLSTFLFSVALVVHDQALSRRGAARWPWLTVGALIGAVAVGSKESAVLVLPLATVVTWSQLPGPFAQRLKGTVTTVLPMFVGVAGWWCWRAVQTGTFGTGSGYGFVPSRIDAAACRNWLQLLLAPAHAVYVPSWVTWPLGAMQTLLLLAAARSFRTAWRACAPALVLLGIGYLAGIGLERIDPRLLENARYSYEPALGLCVLAAVGLTRLPTRARAVVLFALTLTHLLVLHQNRQSWLRVSANYERMQAEVFALPPSESPTRVFDAPGVHDGAFGFMNAATEMRFWRGTAPAGSAPAGDVSSDLEWDEALRELAAVAAAGRPLRAFTVRWTDGGLEPMAVDATWPRTVWPGTTLGYARLGRERPFAGSRLPVQVLIETSRTLRLTPVVHGPRGDHAGPTTTVGPTHGPIGLQLWLALPEELPLDAPVPVSLGVVDGESSVTIPLGSAQPAAR